MRAAAHIHAPAALLIVALMAGGCAGTGRDLPPPASPPAATSADETPPAEQIQTPSAQAEPASPASGARAFLDEARVQLHKAEQQFQAGDYSSTQVSLKEALQLLMDTDQILPSRAALEADESRTEEEVIRHEAMDRLRGEFEGLWTEMNLLYDRLLPFLDLSPLDLAQAQAEDVVDLEAMNAAVEVETVPPPGSADEIRDLLLEMKQEGRIGLDMGIEHYSDYAWDRVYWALSYYLGRGRGNFTVWLERMGRYGNLVEDLLEEEEMPRDLVYLCMIESGLSPRAFSRAAATGPWQFMYFTAQKYGLKTYRNHSVLDERRDFIKSTPAAMAYLKDLLAEFESWPLAMAAYNCGEGRVRGVQRRARRAGGDTGYWGVYNYLPRETRNYVPYFLAALAIGKNMERFGFGDVAFQSRFEDLYEVVHIGGPMTLEMAADYAGTTEEVLRELNPELYNRVTPKEGYELRVPKGSTDSFISGLESMPQEGRKSYLRHVIRRGETGSAIAARYSGVSWGQIRSENGIRDDRSLRVGQEFRIPQYEKARYLTDAEYASMLSSGPSTVAGSGTPVYHTVRRGDSISGIATRYGVTWVQVRQWNGLSGNRILTGQRLRIYGRAVSTGRPAVAAASVPSDGVYTIGRNDTLWDISQRFGVTVNELKEWNGLQGNTIYPGRKLIVTRAAADAARGSGPGSGL